MQIKTIDLLTENELKEVEKIYFETASSNDLEIKYKYFDFYKENYPELFFIYCDEGPKGYICGVVDTLNNYDIMDMHHYLDFYREELVKFPSHLHINVHPNYQGKGAGKALLDIFEKALITHNTVGIHIVTIPGLENNLFYEKQGFTHNFVKKINTRELVLMGKGL